MTHLAAIRALALGTVLVTSLTLLGSVAFCRTAHVGASGRRSSAAGRSGVTSRAFGFFACFAPVDVAVYAC